jgi:hypothetical protein
MKRSINPPLTPPTPRWAWRRIPRLGSVTEALRKKAELLCTVAVFIGVVVVILLDASVVGSAH